MLSRLTIGQRLALGFLVVVLGMVLVTALGVSRVGEIEERLSTINDQNSVKQRYAINFRGSVHDRAISLRDVVLVQTTEEVDEQVADIERLAAAYDESAAELDALVAAAGRLSAGGAGRLRRDRPRSRARPSRSIDEVVALRQAGRHAARRGPAAQRGRPAVRGLARRRSTSSSTSRSP